MDSRGNPISSERMKTGTNLISARNFLGGLPDADANLALLPMERRGVGGLVGLYREMMDTHVGISAAVYWAITEAASLPKEVVWPHTQDPDPEAEAFMNLCRVAVLDEAVVYDGLLEGSNALWVYPLVDAFVGFGLMAPRLMSGGAVEWYPISQNAVMLWRPNGYLLGGVRFSTPNGYDDIDAAELVHTVHGFAGAGEFEGRSMLRSCIQPFAIWKQIAISAGIYQNLQNGFLDISFEPSVAEADVAEFNTFAQAFQDGQRRYLLRPKNVDVEMRYPSGTPADVVSQLEYWDRQIEKQLNAPLAGIAQFGSRAMAETLDGASGRKAKAWINGIFERSSRGMFGWLARQVGYTGKLPKVQVQSAELTTGMDGWGAYVTGVQSGLLTRGPDDEAWGRRVIGAPELPVKEEADVVKDTPAPLLVGSLQIAQEVLSKLVGSAANPVPLAAEAAMVLLQAAGLQEANARTMIEAQMRVVPFTAAPVDALPVEGVAVVAPAPVAPAPDDEPPSGGGGGGAPPAAKEEVTLPGSKITVPAAIGSAPAFAPATSAKDGGNLVEADVDLEPTSGMAAAAERALAWRDEHGRGGTEVGVARARDIKNGRNLSPDTVRRMRAYFTRHASDAKAEGFNSGEEGFPSAGRIAWDLWGGDAGAAWAERKVAELERAGGGNLSDGLILAASLADHPEVAVPDNVKAAAAAALEAHRKAASKTADPEAILLARDLAAGKRLAWDRVLKLARYFAEVYPKAKASKSFADGGPVFHRYELRGGDACRDWVRGLLTAYAMAAHQRASRLNDGGGCGCGEAHGDLGDGEAEGVLAVGADGKEFVTYRELRPEEEVVAWVTLADARRALDVDLGFALDRVAADHRNAVRRALRDGWQPGEQDAIWSAFVPQYAKVLTDAAATLRGSISAEVLNEAARSAGAGALTKMSAAEAAAVSSTMAASANAQLARAAGLTQMAAETIANRVGGEISDAVLGGADPSKWKSRITPLGLADSARASRNQVEGAARVATYADTPEAKGVVPSLLVRSSIPDGKRCSICAERDGEEVNMAANPDAEIPELPDPECLGGANRCRCGWFVVYGTLS